jgi:hypothetical protein
MTQLDSSSFAHARLYRRSGSGWRVPLGVSVMVALGLSLVLWAALIWTAGRVF